MDSWTEDFSMNVPPLVFTKNKLPIFVTRKTKWSGDPLLRDAWGLFGKED
jgi:hypothetical protein